MSISNLHGKIINYKELSKFVPKRNNILKEINYDKYRSISKKLKKGKKLLFMPVQVNDMSIAEDKYKWNYKPVIYGILNDGRKVVLVVDGCTPYFDVRINFPEDCDNEKEYARKFGKKLEKTLNDITDDPNPECRFKDNRYKTKTHPRKDYEIVRAKKFKYYEKSPGYYVRLYFTTLTYRKNAINYVRSKGYTTCSDDLTCYYRVVCRNHLTSFSNWVEISKFKRVSSKNGFYNCDFKDQIIRVNIKNIKPYEGDIVNDPELSKDKCMELCWDIETYSHDGSLPKSSDMRNKLFMIGMTFHWYYMPIEQSLLNICLVDIPCEPHPEYLTVICKNEKNIIKTFAKIFGLLSPEYVLGFNDSDYDWPWLVERAKTHGVLEDVAEHMNSQIMLSNGEFEPLKTKQILSRKYYPTTQIKLDAQTNIKGNNLQFYGYIPVDVRTVYRKDKPNAEKSSLNFFLEENILPLKEDMPYDLLFDIYKYARILHENRDRKFIDTNKNEICKIMAYIDIVDDKKRDWDVKDPRNQKKLKELRDELTEKYQTNFNYDVESLYKFFQKYITSIAYYCVVDCISCHNLMKKKSKISDHREVAHLSFTSMFDAFYRANGMKVRNLVIAIGQTFGYLFSNIPIESKSQGKYPGAYVFPPEKGLKTSKLTMRERKKKGKLDNKKHQDWLKTPNEEIEKYEELIKKHSNEELFEMKDLPEKLKKFLKEKTGRPITGLDFSSLYPSLIMAYNLSPEYILRTYDEMIQAKKDGHEIHEICFEYPLRPDVPEEIKKKNPEKFYVGGWSIRHTNIFDRDDSKFKFGIYPHILKQLFDKRKIMKKPKQFYEMIEEKMRDLGKNKITKSEAIKIVQDKLKQDKNQLVPEDKIEKTLGLPKDKTELPMEDVEFYFGYYDAKQKALKVFMNTFYGEAGNQRSPFFVLLVAGGITSSGQYNIKKAQKYVEDRDCKVYYGDSITGDMPIYRLPDIYNDLGFGISDTIENITNGFEKDGKKWKTNPNGKQYMEFSNDEFCVLDENGPTKVKKIIRHKTYKNIYLIGTGSGFIKVTEDHSLINRDKTEIRPNQCEIGRTKLLHYRPNKIINPISSTKYLQTELLKQPENGDNNLIYIKYKYNEFINGSSGHPIIPGYDSKGTNNCGNMIEFQYDDEHIYMYITKYGSRKYINDVYENYTKHEKYDKLDIVKIVKKLGSANGEYVYDLETESHHFMAGIGNIVVHNTDSIYISVPEKHFVDLDRKYFSNQISKVEYWNECVAITFREIKDINEGVNKMLMEDNKTQFLKMAYEEVLFPVAFLGKKKYYGAEHQSIANFTKIKIFIRGLEVKKRGVSGFLKTLFKEVMGLSVSPENMSTLEELVYEYLDEIYNPEKFKKRNWKYHHFAKTAIYRPKTAEERANRKGNPSVLLFSDRMKAINKPLKPNERFWYVIVRKPAHYWDLRGRKRDTKVGEKMEYLVDAEINKMPIDLDHYVKGELIGQFARLITYRYSKDEDAYLADDEWKKKDAKYVGVAKKELINYCKQMEYFYKHKDYGKIYKNIFKDITTITNKQLFDIPIFYNNNNNGMLEMVLKKCGNEFDQVQSEFYKKINKNVDKYLKDINYVDRKIEKITKKKDIIELQELYYGGRNSKEKEASRELDIEREKLEEKLNEIMSKIKNIFEKYESIVEKLVMNIRNNKMQSPETDLKDIDHEILEKKAKKEINECFDIDDPEMRKKYNNILKDLNRVYRKFYNNELKYKKIMYVVEELKKMRDKKNKSRDVDNIDDRKKKLIVKKDMNDFMNKTRGEDFGIY